MKLYKDLSLTEKQHTFSADPNDECYCIGHEKLKAFTAPVAYHCDNCERILLEAIKSYDRFLIKVAICILIVILFTTSVAIFLLI
jgi:hypothetical protein